MPRGTKRNREDILTEEREKVEAALANVRDKMTKTLDPLKQKEKELLDKKNEIEKELDSLKRDALISIVEKHGITADELEKIIKDRTAAEVAATKEE